MRPTEAFRVNLRAAIHNHPQTMTQICARAGYNTTYVRKVLGGKYNPTLLFAECMAQAVNTNLIDLLWLNDQEDNHAHVPD